MKHKNFNATASNARQKGQKLLEELSRNEECNINTCLQLIRDGAALDIQDGDGNTALSHAAWCGHTSIVTALLENNAPVHTANEHACTILMLAAWRGETDIVTRLIEKGAMLDAQDKDGWTALIHAASQGHGDTVLTLLQNGASTALTRNDSKTAWEVAEYWEYKDIAKTIPDHHVKTTFASAAEKGTPRRHKILRPK